MKSRDAGGGAQRLAVLSSMKLIKDGLECISRTPFESTQCRKYRSADTNGIDLHKRCELILLTRSNHS
jgi:hypothetical protein